MRNSLLNTLYFAAAKGYFLGYPKKYVGQRLSLEERAKITYKLLTRSLKKTELLPMEYSVVLGGFSCKEDISSVSEGISASIPGRALFKEHIHAMRKYLIIYCDFPSYSLLSSLPTLLPHASIYSLRVPLEIEGIPREILCSKQPSKTLQLFNFPLSHDSLRFYLLPRFQGVLRVKEANKTHIIECTDTSSSMRIYKHFLGKEVEGSSIFLVYYPDLLSEIQLYHGKN